MQDIAHHLTGIGYQRHEPVEALGEFSIRGGIRRVSAEAERPVRMEFFGDLIESMRTFDIETQRSVLKISEVTLLPLSEGKGEAASSLVEQAQGALIVIDEPEQTAGAAERLWKRLEEEDEASFLTWDDWQRASSRSPGSNCASSISNSPTPRIPCRPTMAFHGNMPVAVAEAAYVGGTGQSRRVFRGVAR
jgi:transcription-repair coupling factor (superfamily II helicase)